MSLTSNFLEISDIEEKTENGLLTSLLKSIPAGVVVVDEDFQINFTNEKAKEYLTYITTNTGMDFQKTVIELVTIIRKKNQDNDVVYSIGNRSFFLGLIPFLMPQETGGFTVFYFLHLIDNNCDFDSQQERLRKNDTNQLSIKELKILDLMKKGYSNMEIAEELSLSIHTIKTHNENIFQKLNVDCRMMAINKYLALKENKINL